MRILKRILKKLGALLAVLCVVLLAIVGTFFFFPGVVVNDATLPWLVRGLKAYDIGATWEKGHWRARSSSFWRKTLELSLERPCYQTGDPFLKACFRRIDARLEFNLLRRTVNVQKLHVPEGSVLSESGPPAPSTDASPVTPSVLESIELVRGGWLRRVQWEDIRVEKIAVVISSAGSAFRANVTARGTGSKKDRTVSIAAQGTRSEKGRRDPFRAELQVEDKSEGLEYIAGYTSGTVGSQTSFKTTGTITPSQIRGALDLETSRPLRGLRRAVVRGCHYSWVEEPGGKAELSLKCPEKSIRLASTTNEADTLESRLNLDLEMDSKAEVPLRMKADAETESFQQIVAALEETAWAVPAPFNQLRGRVRVEADADCDLAMKNIRSRFTASTALSSPNQQLEAQAKGTVQVTEVSKKPAVDLDADLLLAKARFTLPRLDPTNMPQLFPDPRIIYPEQRSPSQLAFRYRVRVHTPKGEAARLKSFQFNTEIPVELRLVHSSEEGLTGVIRIREFPVSFLRRDARIKRVRIRFPKEGAADLTARVDIHYADYNLRLQAFGPLDAPRYSITSDPPLSENSALALLLFGRPLEELSPGQGESLTSARAALTNGAVSALSMYLLASTPVESVSYDPTNGRFLATVRLVEGTSLRIETAREGTSSIGIRKRLGRNWILNTYVERASPTDDRRSVSTFLEWSKTY